MFLLYFFLGVFFEQESKAYDVILDVANIEKNYLLDTFDERPQAPSRIENVRETAV